MDAEINRRCEIPKIVVTGGPCGGKSTALRMVRTALAARGYRVFPVPETATELIACGISPDGCGRVGFQRRVLRRQLEKEAEAAAAAQQENAEKALILCDRGAADCCSYLSEAEFAEAAAELGQTAPELCDRYDAVFHLTSSAKGAAEFYTTANNQARTETAAEAAALDDRLLAAWTGHPHLRVIPCGADFDAKMQTLFEEILAFLGDPEPVEIERKFLIEYPDPAMLSSLPFCRKVDIEQTYLKTADGSEARVRRRGLDGCCLYTHTVKSRSASMKRTEIERRITEAEYRALLADADPDRGVIRKTRYCLVFDAQYFEIDVYPFWTDRAIAEIELRAEQIPVRLPPELRLIREVTGDPAYKNAALAAQIFKERKTAEMP